MRILVLGAYGLLGSEIARRLARAGHEVVGLGRSAARGRRLLPQLNWIGADIATLARCENWAPLLVGIEAVVNASGALQDGAKDHLRAVQYEAIATLIAACEGANVARFVQISAPGADAFAATAFLRTKGEADAVLRASALDWVIFKPGLVISANAYGGTALLRMLAGFPLLQPVVLAERRIQTVAVADVAEAVLLAAEGRAPMRRDFDLVETEAHTLESVLAKVRTWLGFAPARAVLRLPTLLGFALARLADLVGWLGWRSPLRTTALRVLAADVLGDPAPWRAVRGAPLARLDETLASLPSTLQERSFARGQLAFPILVVTLAGFWIASGAIGLQQRDAAAALLQGSMSEAMAMGMVLAGAAIDIGIGIGVLIRPWTRRAAWAAILVSFGYLAAATVLAPHLWADPLGPLVKIVPGMALALAVIVLAEAR